MNHEERKLEESSIFLMNERLSARIEEMHDMNSIAYEKMYEAWNLLNLGERHRPRANHLFTEAMEILHGYTNPSLTPPKEGN